MAHASGVCVELRMADLPLLPHVLDSCQGWLLIPAGNSMPTQGIAFRGLARLTRMLMNPWSVLLFDAQTSGGILLSVPPEKVDAAAEILLANMVILPLLWGEVRKARADGKELVLK